MSLICNLVFAHDRFDYDTTGNTATAEFSELSRRRALLRPMAQVWSDACDEGFILIGKNGQQGIWTHCATDYINNDVNDDIAGWRFAPYIRNWNAASDTLKSMRILVIND
jgi:hypothetical protein